MRITSLLKRHARAFASVQTGEIRFDPAFSVLCEQNACGFFGACWMCPPDVGNISDWIAKARSYDQAIVFQTVREIEDSFDIEGMNRAARVHNRLIVRLRHAAERDGVDCLLLGAGAWWRLQRCARKKNEPCAHPDRAVVPLEAAGVDVTQL
ncbi:MAG: DUF2284 domain-containing protein [Eubacteriales bacterium]